MDQEEQADFEEWALRTLKIPKAFWDSPAPKDDWTLVIKLHAMVEAAFNDAIVARLNSDEIRPIIEKLDTSNESTGKLAFAVAFGWLDKPQQNFVILLSRLRNHCAHHARNFTFNLAAHFKGLPPVEQTRWLRVISFDASKPNPRKPPPEQHKAVAHNLRGALIDAVVAIMIALRKGSLRRDFLPRFPDGPSESTPTKSLSPDLPEYPSR